MEPPVSISMLGDRTERPGWWVIGIEPDSKVTGHSDSHAQFPSRRLTQAERASLMRLVRGLPIAKSHYSYASESPGAGGTQYALTVQVGKQRRHYTFYSGFKDYGRPDVVPIIKVMDFLGELVRTLEQRQEQSGGSHK